MSNTELKQNPDFKGKNVESQSLVERIFEADGLEAVTAVQT